MTDVPPMPESGSSSRFQPIIDELRTAFPKVKFDVTDDAALLASQISRHVPEAERARWYRYLLKDTADANSPKGFWGLLAANLGVIVLAIAALIVLLGILAGILLPSLKFRDAMGDPNIARGVITFLFAFGTISIALLIAAASYWVGSNDELKERFGYAKDILMVLIGILGTIIGFYFGTSNEAPKQETTPPAEQTSQ